MKTKEEAKARKSLLNKQYRKRLYDKDPTAYKKKRKLNQEILRYGRPRAVILERDNWECQDCGMTQEQNIMAFGQGLTIDHIDKTGINCKEKNNDMDNLRTLCIRCHIKKDTPLIMRERWGDLMDQDDSEYEYPKIRELVMSEAKALGGIQKAKRVVAKQLGVSFWTIDDKCYRRKRRNISVRSQE